MINSDLIKPTFLKRLDHYLLTHFPIIWQSRIIWVAFYSLSLFALAYFFGDYFDQEPGEIIYRDSDLGYNYYLVDQRDFLGFYQIPLFLSVLTMVYWLYLQYQQKINYSRLSIGGFLGVTLLNFACIALLLLPVAGLAYSAFDVTTLLNKALTGVQLILTLGLPVVMLPFIIREFSLIEIVLVIFAGVVYCFLLTIVLSVFKVNSSEGVLGVFLLNFVVLFGLVLVRFYRKTYTQQTKRLALVCVLSFTVIFPYLLYLLDVYYNTYDAYTGVADRHHLFTLKWLVAHILVVLGVYGLGAYFMYRSLLFPIKRK